LAQGEGAAIRKPSDLTATVNVGGRLVQLRKESLGGPDNVLIWGDLLNMRSVIYQ